MITFEDEEEFENAVMSVLHKRLQVNISTRNAGYYSSEGKEIEVDISDSLDGCICLDSTSLPTPSLQY